MEESKRDWSKELREFIIRWNNKFPYDYWWRKKHGVAIFSPEHRKASFINQRLEFEEDRLFNEQTSKPEEEKYIPNIGEWLKWEKSEDGIISQRDIDAFLEEAKMLTEKENALKEKKKENA